MEQSITITDESDLKQNRLGLMSQQQIDDLQQYIDHYQSRIHRLMQRAVVIGGVVTVGMILTVLTGILRLPAALLIEVVVVGGMIYMTTDFNRFIQQLMMDQESRAVRIVKGRTSRYTMRNHPLYLTIRVEVQNYKILDASLAQQFETGELYQLYVLPQSRTVIAAEKLDTSRSAYFN